VDLGLAVGASLEVPISRLNHAVLFVRELDASVAFYRRVFGFEELTRPAGMRAAFLRAAGGENHHDLGLFEVGASAARPGRGSVGLYHLAWEVPSIEELARVAEALRTERSLTGASDHGVSKSLYGRDPDGIEFEVMWRVPRSSWGDEADEAVIRPLDLEAEVARWGAGTTT
jgi:catechol-2,3-dioxygenase